MNRRQILQSLFGYESDEEVASSHEMNHQPNFNSDEKDGGTQLENESISKQGVKIESGAALNDEARSSRFCGGGSKFGDKSISKQGIKVENGAELNNEARSSRLTETEKDRVEARTSAVIRAVFGDSDDEEPAEYEVQDGTDCGENDCISPEHKVNCEKELKSEGVISDEDTQYASEEEKTEAELEGQSVCRLLVLEIPQRTPLADPSQMATIELSNLIGIDCKPFDPKTYVEEDFYVTHVSGSKRLIPPSNIIRWRNVINPDGTISVESNAQFVTWSDGSLQLLIGNEAFDISEEEADEIHSLVFLWNEGIYKAIGRIDKTVKVESLSSNSNCLTALVDSQDKEVHNVGQGIIHADSEMVAEQSEQAEQKATEDNAWLNQRKNNKKATRRCNLKDSKEHHVSPSNAEDVNDEGPKDPHQLA